MGLVRAGRKYPTYCLAEHTAGSNVPSGAGYTKISLPSFVHRSQVADFTLTGNNIVVSNQGMYLVTAQARLNTPGGTEDGRFTLRLTESNSNIIGLSVANGSRVGQASALISIILPLATGNAIGFECNHEFSSTRPLQPGSYGTSISLLQIA